MKNYNITQLHPEQAFENHVFHRDMFAHYLRFSHVLKKAEIGMKILDVGCGSGNLYEVLYRNRYSPERYLGLDIRKQTIEKNKLKFPKAEFQRQDLVGEMNYGADWDIIASFETIEHTNKKNVKKFIDNIAKHCNQSTIVLLSTPNFDPKVGAAANHIYDGQIQEYDYSELNTLLEEKFDIVNKWGTFASIKDYKHLLSQSQLELWNKLNDYYDTNFLAVIFDPLFPKESRN